MVAVPPVIGGFFPLFGPEIFTDFWDLGLLFRLPLPREPLPRALDEFLLF